MKIRVTAALKQAQYIRVLRSTCEVWLSLIFLGPELFWNLGVFEKTNLAKLVMQVSEKAGEPEPVWNQDFKDYFEVGLSLMFLVLS